VEGLNCKSADNHCKWRVWIAYVYNLSHVHGLCCHFYIYCLMEGKMPHRFALSVYLLTTVTVTVERGQFLLPLQILFIPDLPSESHLSCTCHYIAKLILFICHPRHFQHQIFFQNDSSAPISTSSHVDFFFLPIYMSQMPGV
jgi:hypothetical protein